MKALTKPRKHFPTKNDPEINTSHFCIFNKKNNYSHMHLFVMLINMLSSSTQRTMTYSIRTLIIRSMKRL